MSGIIALALTYQIIQVVPLISDRVYTCDRSTDITQFEWPGLKLAGVVNGRMLGAAMAKRHLCNDIH